MSQEQDVITGNDAKHLLDNKLFKGAFNAVADLLDDKALTCDPDNKEMAQRIIISKQLLAGIRREIERYIDNGYIANIQLSELEQKRQNKLMRYFRR
jgi:hypothetical protein